MERGQTERGESEQDKAHISADPDFAEAYFDIAEIGVCHYRNPVDRYMIAKFNRHCTGSFFDRLFKASRALSKKNKDGATVREVKVWIRIAVSKRDQHSMFLLRQMSKTGQAVAVDVNKGGKPTALVMYGESKEYRRLQFETAEDVRAVMNDESRAQELKAEQGNTSRMAEYEWNSIQTTASHKLVYMKNAQNKSDLRLSSFASTGAEKTLSEACRIGVGLTHRERLKQVLWRNAPNTSFGVQNKKQPRENKDTKKRNRDSANDTAVGEGGPPSKTSRTTQHEAVPPPPFRVWVCQKATSRCQTSARLLRRRLGFRRGDRVDLPGHHV
jgi:hypothetical protein